MALSFFEIRKKTDLSQSWGLCWVFQISWHIECSTLLPLSFRIWNSTAGTASTPLALFVVMLPKSHLTSHSRISGSRWVSHHKTFFSVFFFLFFTIFYFTILYWFCHTSTWIRHGCSRVPNPEPPLPLPSPYHLSVSSQCTSPKHPESRIEPRLVVRFLYDIIHVSMPLTQIIPPSPSPTESKRL